MKAEELVDRFKYDLNTSMAIRSNSRSLMNQIKDTANFNLEEFVGALNPIGFNGYLKNILQLINAVEPSILTYVNEESIDLKQTIYEVTLRRDELIERVQYFIDNPSLVGYPHNQSIAEMLEEQFGNLHSVAGTKLN